MTSTPRHDPLLLSRGVWLRPGARRSEAVNSNTISHSAMIDPIGPWVYQERFMGQFREIRELVERCPRPGVALVAVDHDGVAASGFLAARPHEITAGVVGRHSVADFFLQGDEALSLRHLMLIVHPAGPLREPRLRLLDLRTSAAFRDEHGRHLQGLESEGHALVSAGRYTLFCFALSHDDHWPDDARAAWDCLPERIYFQDAPAEPDRWARKQHRPRRRASARGAVRDRRCSTLMESIPGPSLACDGGMVSPDELPLGELHITEQRGSGRLPLGAAALRRGVLIGRSLRCDGAGLPVLQSPCISRVHLLLILLHGVVYAVDVASMHGMRRGGERVKLCRLQGGETVVLGDGLAELRWERPARAGPR